VLTHTVQLTTSDVEVGAFDSDTNVFDTYSQGENVLAVNAVRIATSGADVVPMLGHFVFGTDALAVHATSLAQRELGSGPIGSSDCFLPFAIPDCHLAGLAPGTNPEPMAFTMSPSPTDSIAWGDPDHNPNTNDTRDQLVGQCANGDVAVGDPLYVNEGNHTSALKTLGDVLNQKTTATTTPWNASLYGALPPRNGTTANLPSKSSVTAANWGTTLQGPVALVDAGTNCAAVAFTGSKPITGFAWAVVYDTANSGSTKNVWIQLDVTSPHETWGDVDETAKGTNVTGVGDASLGGG
jgi:hypothetical protein